MNRSRRDRDYRRDYGKKYVNVYTPTPPTSYVNIAPSYSNSDYWSRRPDYDRYNRYGYDRTRYITTPPLIVQTPTYVPVPTPVSTPTMSLLEPNTNMLTIGIPSVVCCMILLLLVFAKKI